MKTIIASVVSPFIERLGWTLIHSLWQLVAIALVAAMVNRCLRRRSADIRYIVSVSALMLMIASPCATWCMVSVTPDHGTTAVWQLDEDSSELDFVPLRMSERGAKGDLDSVVQRPETTEASLVGVALDPGHSSAAQVQSEKSVIQEPQKPGFLEKPGFYWQRVTDETASTLQPRLPMLVGFWIVGVLVCSIRPIWSLYAQWRLRRTGLSQVAESVRETMLSLAHRMSMRRAVRIAESTLVKVPMVVGYLRPMILLPASVLMGLTPLQLEAVLAHELAHVRRHDWLINALQVMTETLLFYHPAIWWISRQIRHERELCCDDIALGLNVDKAVYARMLLTLEELQQKSLTPGLAATGGHLAARVRRLLSRSESIHMSNPPASFSGLVTMASSLVLLFTVLASQSQTAPRDPAVVVTAPVTLREESKPESAATEAATTPDGSPVVAEATADSKTEGLRKRTVKVVDEDEQPVAGAEVRLQFENRSTAQLAAPLSTDANGEVTVDAPLNFDKVHLSVKAEGFGEFSGTQSATGSSTIQLQRGRFVHVRAVDDEGNVLSKAVPLLEQDRIWGREFVPQEDSSFKSPAVALERRLMRVVSAQQNGPFLFSELIDVASAQPGEDGILQLALKPGTKLTGRLDDAVPRPITEGYVKLTVVEGADHKFRMDPSNNKLRTNEWTWEDSTQVQPDGTFSFESVPGGGHAQIHVVVDGYMSVNPPIADLLTYLQKHGLADEQTPEYLNRISSRAMWPILVPLDQEKVSVNVKCGPTASCDFRILDPAGNPVPDAEVSFSPNGIFLKGRLFIPGSNTFQNANLVDQMFHGVASFGIEVLNGDESQHSQAIKRENAWGQRHFLSAKSNADGRVQIRNLPGGTRESFRVTADGLVLPHSPLYPGFEDRREGYVDLIAGETIERTIYLDREQSVVDRELLVVDEKSKPLENVTVALAEMLVGDSDWQQWSVQRFGALPEAKTDSNGRVVLKVPNLIDQVPVQRLRFVLNHTTNKAGELWLSGGLIEAPLTADNGVVMIVRDKDTTRSSRAMYGKLEDLLPKRDSAELLKAMIKNPGLAMLRQLLTNAPTPHAEPVELLDAGRHRSEKEGLRVHVLPAGDSNVAVVLARVHPADGSRSEETELQRLPDCAFVLDMQGNLIATLGGRIGTTGSGSAENVDIVCLGPAEDWFVRVTRFQDNGPFKYQSEYYRMANPVVPSLRYYHYANSNPWSNGPEDITRFGRLSFEFPEDQGPFVAEKAGTTPDGRSFNGTIYWDGDKDRFVGAAALAVENRPLFQVDTEWSQDFDSLTTTASQMTLIGGAREYDHWYSWETYIPDGFEATVSVTIPQSEGAAKVIDRKYASGRQLIQFQAKPSDDAKTTKIQLNYGKDEPVQTAELPHTLGDAPASSPPVVNTVKADETIQLLNRPLTSSSESLILAIRLQMAP